METEIVGEIKQLGVLSRQKLLELWQKLQKREAPEGIRRELLIPFLAYKIQENAYGGLKATTRTELRRLAREMETSQAGKTMKLKPRMKSGTRLFREWRGKMYEVFVTEGGFEYQGAAHRSLSEIARKITGTQWSGPAFFGLKNSATSERQTS